MGLDYAAVGNHEFDEGVTELLRMQNGGCLTAELNESCPDHEFQGADWQYLRRERLLRGVRRDDPAAVRHRGGRRHQGRLHRDDAGGHAGVVTPTGVAGLDFADEAATANRYAEELMDHGVRSIVVAPARGRHQTGATDVDGCTGLTGAITEIVPQMSHTIDAVITGTRTRPTTAVEVDGRLRRRLQHHQGTARHQR